MKKIQPKEGATRTIRKFLIFPKTLPWSRAKEARLVKRQWEWTEIFQEFRNLSGWDETCMYWVDVAWNDMVWATVESLEKEAEWEEKG